LSGAGTKEDRMNALKTTLAALAAAGLAAAQPAAAAPARTASPVADTEQLAGGVPSAAWPAIIAILAVAAYALISASNDDDDDAPVSP
jgi:hypothetical protein